jgi:hypothetical protein
MINIKYMLVNGNIITDHANGKCKCASKQFSYYLLFQF